MKIYLTGPNICATLRAMAHVAGAGTYRERLEHLMARRRMIDQLEVEFAADAAEFASLPEFFEEHADSAIAVLRDSCHMTSRAAAQAICVGEQLRRLPETEISVLEGEIGFAHLGVIAYTAAALTTSETSRGFNEEWLAIKARQLTVKGLIRACMQYRHAMDPQAYEQEEREGVEARFLELQTRDDGCVWLKGFFDNEGGSILKAALEPLAQKEGDADERELPRRHADALLELAGGGRPAHVQISATVESLARVAGCPAAEIESGWPLSTAALWRLTCDCNLARVLLDSESKIIDVGRVKRTVTEAQRRALMHRDRTCRWPGCLRPARRCAAHHLKHWADGGETNLDNLISLCGRHHWLVHEGGWQLEGSIGQDFIAIPPRPAWWTDLPAA